MESSRSILDEVMSQKIIRIVDEQLYILQHKLDTDVFSLRNLSSFQPSIAVMGAHIELANALLAYAKSRKLNHLDQIETTLSSLKPKLDKLRKTRDALQLSLEKNEEEHQQQVSSPRSSQPRPAIFRSRTLDEDQAFLKDVAKLDEPRLKVLGATASACTKILTSVKLLSILEKELVALVAVDSEFYSHGILNLTLQKIKPNLDGFVSVYRDWHTKNKELLGAYRASIGLLNPIAEFYLILSLQKQLSSYGALAKAEGEINRFYFNSPSCDPRITMLRGVLSFEEKVEKLYELQVKKIRSDLLLEKLTKAHVRTRSKSTSESPDDLSPVKQKQKAPQEQPEQAVVSVVAVAPHVEPVKVEVGVDSDVPKAQPKKHGRRVTTHKIKRSESQRDLSMFARTAYQLLQEEKKQDGVQEKRTDSLRPDV